MSVDITKFPQVCGAGRPNQVWLRTTGPKKEKEDRRVGGYNSRGPNLRAETEGRPLHWHTPSLQLARFSSFKGLCPSSSVHKNHPKWFGSQEAWLPLCHCQTTRAEEKAEVGKTFYILGVKFNTLPDRNNNHF